MYTKIVAVVCVLVLLGAGTALWMTHKPTPAPVSSATIDAKDVLSAFGANNAAGDATRNSTSNSNQTIMYAVLHTNKGDITIEFLANQAPNTATNFAKLAQAGFYSGVKFHRVIPGFMIQGGDPLSKDDANPDKWGTGGPGYSFMDEIGAANSNAIGTVSMANSGPNTNGSQFFINVANNNFLDTKHTVFAKVVSGMDVVTAIEHVKTGEADRPVEPVIIESVTLK